MEPRLTASAAACRCPRSPTYSGAGASPTRTHGLLPSPAAAASSSSFSARRRGRHPPSSVRCYASPPAGAAASASLDPDFDKKAFRHNLARSGKVQPEDLASLKEKLDQEAIENLGMAMVYTLVTSAKEWLSEKYGQNVGDEEPEETEDAEEEGKTTINGSQLQSSSSDNGMLVDGMNQRTRKLGEKQDGDGKEVALRSLIGSQIVAYGRLRCTNKKAKGLDGLPLGEYYEVLIDVVLDKNVLLPRVQGQATKLGAAIGRCIAWPLQNVVQKDGSPLNMTRRAIDFRK